MRVFAITFGNNEAASTRFRLLQYQDALKAAGVELTWVEKKALRLEHIEKIKKADAVLVQKALLFSPLVWWLRKLAKRIVYDMDDAIWTRPGKPYSRYVSARLESRLGTILSAADAVTCANEYLAEKCLTYNKNVSVVPMALEVGPFARAKAPREMTLGWMGGPGNLELLKICEEPVGEFLKAHPEGKLKIMCGVRPKLAVPFEHVPWRAQDEAEFVKSLSIGLLPLDQVSEFTLGKSPIKALMYGAAGVPTVGNMTHGGAAEIARGGGCRVVRTAAEWRTALEELADENVRTAEGKAALENIRTHNDAQVVFEQLLKILRG